VKTPVVGGKNDVHSLDDASQLFVGLQPLMGQEDHKVYVLFPEAGHGVTNALFDGEALQSLANVGRSRHPRDPDPKAGSLHDPERWEQLRIVGPPQVRRDIGEAMLLRSFDEELQSKNKVTLTRCQCIEPKRLHSFKQEARLQLPLVQLS